MESQVANSQLLHAVLCKQTIVAQQLIELGAKSGTIDPLFGTTPLLAACNTSQVALVPLLVTRDNVDVNDRTGQTALMILIKKLHARIEYLRRRQPRLKSLAEIERSDIEHNSLRYTHKDGLVRLQENDKICQGLEDALKALRLAGADDTLCRVRKEVKTRYPYNSGRVIERKNSMADNSLKLAKKGEMVYVETEETGRSLATALFDQYLNIWDVCCGRALHSLSSTVALYKEWGVELDYGIKDVALRTLLHHAADNGQIDTCKQLLQSKSIDAEAQDVRGQNALHCAAQRGHPEVVLLLLAHAPLLALAQDSQGRTPLHLWPFARTRSANSEALRRLVAASTAASDHLGLTQLHVCVASGGTKDATKLLLASLQQCDVTAVEEVERRRKCFMKAPQPARGYMHLLPWHRRRQADLLTRRRKWEDRAKQQGWLGWQAALDKHSQPPTAVQTQPEGRYGGRSVWEMALAARNKAALAALAEHCGGTFPAPVGNDPEALRLAMATCSHAELVPDDALKAAWARVKGDGERWPARIGVQLGRFLQREGDLAVTLGGWSIVAAAVVQAAAEQSPQRTQVVRALLEAGADPEGGAGFRALEYAVAVGDAEMVEVLVAHGADAQRLLPVDGRCHWCGATCGGRFEAEECALERGDAARELADKIQQVRAFPRVDGAKVDNDEAHQLSVVGLAVLLGKIGVVEALVESGARGAVGYVTPRGEQTSVLKMMLAAAKSQSTLPKPHLHDGRWQQAALRLASEGDKDQSLLAMAVDVGWGAVALRLATDVQESKALDDELRTRAALVAVVQRKGSSGGGWEEEVAQTLLGRGVRLSGCESAGGVSLVELALSRGHTGMVALLCQHAKDERTTEGVSSMEAAREVLLVRAAAREINAVAALSISGLGLQPKSRPGRPGHGDVDAVTELAVASRAGVRLSTRRLLELMSYERRVRKALAKQGAKALLGKLLALLVDVCSSEALQERVRASARFWDASVTASAPAYLRGLNRSGLPALLDGVDEESLLAEQVWQDAVVAVVAATSWVLASPSEPSAQEVDALEAVLPLLFACVTGNAQLASAACSDGARADALVPLQWPAAARDAAPAAWMLQGLFALVDWSALDTEISKLRMVTPLGCAILHDTRQVANANGNISVVEALMDAQGPGTVAYTTVRGDVVSPLHLLVQAAQRWTRRPGRDRKRWENIGLRMVDSGAKDEGTEGNSSLEKAVQGGWTALAIGIVDSGEQLVGDGYRALLHAVARGDVEVVRRLMQRQLLEKLTQSERWNVLEAARKHRSQKVATTLTAGRAFSTSQRLRLLADCGCCEAFEQIWAPLAEGDKEELLRAHPAEGRTLLMCAAYGGSTGILTQLFATGSKRLWEGGTVRWFRASVSPPSAGLDRASLPEDLGAQRFDTPETERPADSADCLTGFGAPFAQRNVTPLEYALEHQREAIVLFIMDAWIESRPALTPAQARNLGGLAAVRGFSKVLQKLLASDLGPAVLAAPKPAGSGRWGACSWLELAAVSCNVLCWITAAAADAAVDATFTPPPAIADVPASELQRRVYRALFEPALRFDGLGGSTRPRLQRAWGSRTLPLGEVAVDEGIVEAILSTVQQRGDEQSWEWALQHRNAGVLKVLSQRKLAESIAESRLAAIHGDNELSLSQCRSCSKTAHVEVISSGCEEGAGSREMRGAETVGGPTTESVAIEDEASTIAKETAASALHEVARADALRQRIQERLAEVAPVLEAARSALGSICRKELDLIRALPNPPPAVKTAVRAVMVMLDRQPRRIHNRDGAEATAEWWGPARKEMQKADFVGQILAYDLRKVPSSILQRVRSEFIADPSFTPDHMRKACRTAASLCMWVRAADVYARVLAEVQPLVCELDACAVPSAAGGARGEPVAAAARAEPPTVASDSGAPADELRGAMAALQAAERLVNTRQDHAAAAILREMPDVIAAGGGVAGDSGREGAMLRQVTMKALRLGCRQTAKSTIENDALRSLSGWGEMGVEESVEILVLSMTVGDRAWANAWIEAGLPTHCKLLPALAEWLSKERHGPALRENDLNEVLHALRLTDFPGPARWIELQDRDRASCSDSATKATTWSRPAELGGSGWSSEACDESFGSEDGSWVAVEASAGDDSEWEQAEPPHSSMQYGTEYSECYQDWTKRLGKGA